MRKHKKLTRYIVTYRGIFVNPPQQDISPIQTPVLLALSGVDAGGGLVGQLVHVVASIGGSV